MQYERILEQLKQHNTLPEKLRAECASFSKLAMIEQGVEYVLEVKAKQKKTLTLLYDKEACGNGFNPQKKIFIGGYNRYGTPFSQGEKSQRGVALTHAVTPCFFGFVEFLVGFHVEFIKALKARREHRKTNASSYAQAFVFTIANAQLTNFFSYFFHL